MGYPDFPSPKISAKIMFSPLAWANTSFYKINGNFVHLNTKIQRMKKILIVLVVLLILIQFFRIDKANPPVNPGMDFLTIKETPQNTASLIRNACYDCHSNETKYPWYSNFQPVGWFLKDHIDEGRKKLNFSLFATYEPKRQAHKLHEAAEVTENGEMPMDSYLIGHPEAQITVEERKILADYFRKTETDIRISHQLPAEEE